mgnify:CR=1 FL=1
MGDIKKSVNRMLRETENIVSNIYSNSDVSNKIILLVISIIIIVFTFLLYNKLSLQKYNCNRLDKLYKEGSLYFNATGLTSNKYNNSRFIDLFTMAAYNCCNAGAYKNDFVDLCALDKCIKLGVRCLDFQVFSLNNRPIVSSSTLDMNYVKETYNYLDLTRVLDFIKINAFKPDNTPNNNDPLILHIRVMSDNPVLYTNLLNIYKNVFSNSSNPSVYINDNITLPENNNRLFEKNILELKNKVILIIKPFNNFNLSNINTNLRKYINLESIDSNSNKAKDNNKCILYYGNRTFSVIDRDTNRRYISICIPEYENYENNNNTNFLQAMRYGTSLIAMKMQYYDTNLASYFYLFKKKGNYVFYNKPDDLQGDLFNNNEKLSGDNVELNELGSNTVSMTNSMANI